MIDLHEWYSSRVPLSYLNLYTKCWGRRRRKEKKFDWSTIYDIDVEKIKWVTRCKGYREGREEGWFVTDWYGHECLHPVDGGTSFDWCLRQTSIIIFDVFRANVYIVHLYKIRKLNQLNFTNFTILRLFFRSAR